MEKIINTLKKDVMKAYKKDEVPIAALITDENGKILSHAYNKTEKNKNVISHAEILTILKANKKKNNWRLIDCTLYVTLEPCLTCANVIVKSRIKKVVYFQKSNYLTKEEKTFIDQLYQKNHVEILYEDSFKEYQTILQSFFKNKRK